jgi:hypothetical protein
MGGQIERAARLVRQKADDVRSPVPGGMLGGSDDRADARCLERLDDVRGPGETQPFVTWPSQEGFNGVVGGRRSDVHAIANIQKGERQIQTNRDA